MVGMKGRSGGARPGAGGKKKATVEQQHNRRSVVLDVVSEKVWRDTVTEWIAAARLTGNFSILFPLLPYIMGAAKQEINVSGTVEHVQMNTARSVLRVVGGTERSA